MSNIIPLQQARGTHDLGAMAFVLERLDGALFNGGREEDPLERMAREDVAAEALHELLSEYLDEGHGVARVSETECLARLFGYESAVAS